MVTLTVVLCWAISDLCYLTHTTLTSCKDGCAAQSCLVDLAGLLLGTCPITCICKVPWAEQLGTAPSYLLNPRLRKTFFWLHSGCCSLLQRADSCKQKQHSAAQISLCIWKTKLDVALAMWHLSPSNRSVLLPCSSVWSS